MFGRAFWGAAFYGPRYFGDGGSGEPPAPPPAETRGGAWYDYAPGERRKRGLEWKRRTDRTREELEAAYARIMGEVPAEDAKPVVALVKPFVEASYDTATPPVAAIDWSAFQQDLAAVEGLLAALKVIEEMDEEDAVMALLMS